MTNLKLNRIAAIDIGTNSFHLIIAEVKQDGSFDIIDKDRIVLRLSSELGNDVSSISEEKTVEAIKVLRKFLESAEKHNAVIRAVATSAVRESINRNEFIDRVKKETSLDIEVIDGKYEAHLIFTGIKKALRIENKNVLCIDIGGGSTEFIYSKNTKVVFAESIKIGAVRLSQRFFPDFIITKEAISQCSNYVINRIKDCKEIDMSIRPDFAIGVSGTVDSIFFIKQYQKYGKVVDKMNGFTYSKSDLINIYNLIMSLKTPSERLNVNGMEAKRADIIPAGLIILKSIFDIFKLDKIKISEYALREGIVIDTYNRLQN